MYVQWNCHYVFFFRLSYFCLLFCLPVLPYYVVNKDEYYVAHHSSVYCTMLDATKAFARVKCTKLFRLLTARRLPHVVLRVLLFKYTQHCSSSWNFCLSGYVNDLNGVKLEGVMSPVLFCVYTPCPRKKPKYFCHIFYKTWTILINFGV